MEAFYGVKVRPVNPDRNDQMEIHKDSTSSKVTAKELEKALEEHYPR